jgi:hypothetical protein
MIDIREMQRRGVVRIPRKEINIPETAVSKDGFVDFGSSSKPSFSTDNLTSSPETADSSNASFFGFMDGSASSSDSGPTEKFSTEVDGYSKREVDAKMVDLDNKVYKLEQRIELLEKKLDVGQSNSSSSVGAMGW